MNNLLVDPQNGPTVDDLTPLASPEEAKLLLEILHDEQAAGRLTIYTRSFTPGYYVVMSPSQVEPEKGGGTYGTAIPLQAWAASCLATLRRWTTR
jgi:hypothetical protein